MFSFCISLFTSKFKFLLVQLKISNIARLQNCIPKKFQLKSFLDKCVFHYHKI